MRIIAFGCSYTYGHGLSDCLDNDMMTQGPTHSNLAYPSILAEKLNCDESSVGKKLKGNHLTYHDVSWFVNQYNFNPMRLLLKNYKK
jgi:hypothetical protein